jgi:hypothetical protein
MERGDGSDLRGLAFATTGILGRKRGRAVHSETHLCVPCPTAAVLCAARGGRGGLRAAGAAVRCLLPPAAHRSPLRPARLAARQESKQSSGGGGRAGVLVRGHLEGHRAAEGSLAAGVSVAGWRGGGEPAPPPPSTASSGVSPGWGPFSAGPRRARPPGPQLSRSQSPAQRGRPRGAASRDAPGMTRGRSHRGPRRGGRRRRAAAAPPWRPRCPSAVGGARGPGGCATRGAPGAGAPRGGASFGESTRPGRRRARPRASPALPNRFHSFMALIFTRFPPRPAPLTGISARAHGESRLPGRPRRSGQPPLH